MMICIGNNYVNSQTTLSKSLPQPKFYVLGINESDFPKLNGNWEDTMAMLEYGKNIDNWLQSNVSIKERIIASKNNNDLNQFNTAFFKSLNDEQKIRFKETAKKLSYIIIGQKEILMDNYFSSHIDKKQKVDFYNEVEQIYVIHQADLNYILKIIKG